MGFNRIQSSQEPSIIRRSYNGPAKSSPVSKKAWPASNRPRGQYPNMCHASSAERERVTIINVVREHAVVERETARILAWIAEGSSLGRKGEALAAGMT